MYVCTDSAICLYMAFECLSTGVLVNIYTYVIHIYTHMYVICRCMCARVFACHIHITLYKYRILPPPTPPPVASKIRHNSGVLFVQSTEMAIISK